MQKLFKIVISRIQSLTRSGGSRIRSLVRPVGGITSEKSPARKYTIASAMQCAGNTGPWTTLASNHAPIFSLFTYFPNRT
ncbi:MAG: hypothetical protein WC598_11735 [Methanoregula sp.]